MRDHRKQHLDDMALWPHLAETAEKWEKERGHGVCVSVMLFTEDCSCLFKYISVNKMYSETAHHHNAIYVAR